MDFQATDGKNVVQCLQARLKEASEQGVKVRLEILEEEQASWCLIGTKPTVFIDLSQTASEQLRQLEEILAEYQAYRRRQSEPTSKIQAA